jgi:uncharacterized protein YjaZ
MMGTKIHLLLESGRLRPYATEILAAAGHTLALIHDVLNTSGIDVVIGDNPLATIPETGFGGSTPNSHLVLIWADPTNDHFRHGFRDQLRHTISHEIYHAVRNKFVPWTSDTLFGAMISEGLADHFDIQLNGGGAPLWASAIKKTELDHFLEKAAPLFDSREYDHRAWFFGDSSDIPRWAGYSMGFQIVDAYLRKTGKKVSELVAAQPTIFH